MENIPGLERPSRSFVNLSLVTCATLTLFVACADKSTVNSNGMDSGGDVLDASAVAPGDAGYDAGVDAGSPFPSGACTAAPVAIVHEELDGSTVQNIEPRVYKLDTTTYAGAVCNDGTPPQYSIQPGYGGGANRWIVSFEGGGNCKSQSDCQMRAQQLHYLVTSAPPQPVGAILSSSPTENPDFYDANIVRIHYCSSDSWNGTQTGVGAFAAADPATWNFRGHAIAKAVVQDLLAQRGMATATEVILHGESAGADGLFVNANMVANLLPSNVRLVAIPDAPFDLNIPSFDGDVSDGISTAPPPYLTFIHHQIARAFWKGTGDIYCEQTVNADDPSCTFATYLVANHYFSFPFFLRQSEEDASRLTDQGVQAPPAPPGDAGVPVNSYYVFFEGQERAALNSAPAPYSAFGPNITEHTTTNDPYAFVPKKYIFPDAGSISTQQAIHVWYENPCVQIKWIE